LARKIRRAKELEVKIRRTKELQPECLPGPSFLRPLGLLPLLGQ
jgi:hypothetical protein